MSEHLTLERLSAVLDTPDTPDADDAAVAHLRACGDCQREYEAMSRMRMALSGMREHQPPVGSWSRIESALPTEAPPAIPIRPRRRAFGLLTSLPLQAAAALVVFAVGLMIGTRLREAGEPDGTPAVATVQEAASPRTIDPGRVAYEDAFQRLQELRSVSAQQDVSSDPAAAAERLIQLDALVEASRQALRSAPGDPAVNDFLFEVTDERDALSAELNDVLHATTVEYR